MHCTGNTSLRQRLLYFAVTGSWAIQSSLRYQLYLLSFFFHLSLFLPSLGYTGDMAARERKPLTRFLQIWKINKNVMNNTNFSFSWVHNAVQEAGREQWGWFTVRQWLFPLRWSRNCPFPGNIWNGNAAGVGGVHWEEPKPDSGISHKLLCHRGKQAIVN